MESIALYAGYATGLPLPDVVHDRSVQLAIRESVHLSVAARHGQPSTWLSLLERMRDKPQPRERSQEDVAFWHRLSDLNSVAERGGVPVEHEAEWMRLELERSSRIPCLDTQELARLEQLDRQAAQGTEDPRDYAEHTYLLELRTAIHEHELDAEDRAALRAARPGNADDTLRAGAWSRIGVARCTAYTTRERARLVCFCRERMLLLAGEDYFAFIGGRYVGPFTRREAHSIAREAKALAGRIVDEHDARDLVDHAFVVGRVEFVPGIGLPEFLTIAGHVVARQPVREPVERLTRAERVTWLDGDKALDTAAWVLEQLRRGLECGEPTVFRAEVRGEPVIGFSPTWLREQPGAPKATLSTVIDELKGGRVRRPGAGRSSTPMPWVPASMLEQHAAQRAGSLSAAGSPLALTASCVRVYQEG